MGVIEHFWAVVPAGGAGTRLWPLSRRAHPKFLHDLTGDGRSLLQATVDRLAPLGFLLDDAARSSMLATSDRNQTPEAWAARAHTRFEGGPHPVEIAAAAIDMIRPDVAGAYRERLHRLDLRGILARVPAVRMSEPAQQFAVRVAESNRAHILSHLTRTMDP